MFIVVHGVSYVNWPKLIPLTDIIEYSGPGTKTSKNGRGVPLLDHVKQRNLASVSSNFSRQKDEMEYGVKERLD